MYINSNWAKNT